MNKFKPGDKVLCIRDGSDVDWKIQINTGSIYTVIKVVNDIYYTSNYKVYIEETKLAWDISFFESAEKLIHDKKFNNKLETLIND